MIPKKFDTDFKNDVYKGLTTYPKFLSSKYFYDEEGSKIFQEIMAMDEYYVTNSETEVFNQNAQEIAKSFIGSQEAFDLVELGAGDGTKTKILLKALLDNNANITYKPIDISQSALNGLGKRMNKIFPNLNVDTLQGEYFKVLNNIKELKNRKKVILFLGSNIGNLPHPLAIDFLNELRKSMNDEDVLFVGMDQKKDPEVIRDAYNDKGGITARFNLNVLKRINRELNADFDLKTFIHYPIYNPEIGTAASYLLSTTKQEVQIKSLDLNVSFEKWETIHTEISQKYDDEIVKWLADKSELKLVYQFSDNKHYFTNYLFKK